MRGHHVAVFGLGLSALLAPAFTFTIKPTPALAQPDDDEDEKPQKGPRLAPGQELGLALTFSRGDLKDTRHARVVALDVPAGTPPSGWACRPCSPRPSPPPSSRPRPSPGPTTRTKSLKKAPGSPPARSWA